MPAAIRFKQDLLAGQSFADAVADAQATTGVTITSFEDASMVEYALLLVAVLLLAAAGAQGVSQPLHDDLAGVVTHLQASLNAIGAPGACSGGPPVIVP